MMQPTLYELQQAVFNKLQNLIPIHGDRVLEVGNEDYTWKYIDYKTEFWTASFWPGQLWLAYKMTAQEQYKNAARMSREYFNKYLDTPRYHDHDVGFLFSLTSVADYKLTSCDFSKKQAIRAAEILASRYKPFGAYIVAWQPFTLDIEKTKFVNDRIIVDTLQNLPLLLWAARETGREAFKDIAISHANTTAKYLVRDDFSCFHTYLFDPSSQMPLRGETHQGYNHNSSWSRGQSWLIHGYANLAYEYELTQYIELADNLAEYAIAHLKQEDDFVPLWDFSNDPNCPSYFDSSAGAIMASGFFILSDLIKEKQDYYREWGLKLIYGLTNKCGLLKNTEAHGLLAHGASHVRDGLADNMLPYGDYYYLEAILRARGIQRFFW